MTKEIPLYRVVAPTYLDGNLYNAENQPKDGLAWEGAPNEALEPLNAAAEAAAKARDAERREREARATAPITSASLRDAGKDVGQIERQRDAAIDRAETAEARVDELLGEVTALTTERDALAAQVAKFDHDKDGKIGGATGQNPNPTVDVVQPTPALNEGHEVLAPAPQTVDPLEGADDATRDAIEKRLRPFEEDHQHAPSAAESAAAEAAVQPAPKPAKPARSPEEAKDRAEAIAILREKKVKFFAGATTEALVAQASEA